MEEKTFNTLFEKSEKELEELKAEIFTRWTFDTGTDEDRAMVECIEVILEARDRTGLRK